MGLVERLLTPRMTQPTNFGQLAGASRCTLTLPAAEDLEAGGLGAGAAASGNTQVSMTSCSPVNSKLNSAVTRAPDAAFAVTDSGAAAGEPAPFSPLPVSAATSRAIPRTDMASPRLGVMAR